MISRRDSNLTVVTLSVLILAGTTTLVGCEGRVNTGQSTKQEMEQTERNHERLVKAVPPPKLGTSQERVNLKKRLERFNSETKVSYIYLVDHGKVMAFYSVKGKVSSVNSLLTTPQQIITGWAGPTGNKHYYTHTIPSPDLDGSYGSNGDAVFFFTTEDVYVEWKGDYLLCDAPLKLTTPPEIIIDISKDRD